MSEERIEQLQTLLKRMNDFTPHAGLLGICVDSIEGEKLTLRLPWRQEFIANPATGVIHTGVVTFLMEHTLGVSTLCSQKLLPSLTPTLDLRVDYIGQSTSSSDIMATAWVYSVREKVVFVEGIAWCDTPEDPIAKATGTSMVLQQLDFQQLGDLWEQHDN